MNYLCTTCRYERNAGACWAHCAASAGATGAGRRINRSENATPLSGARVSHVLLVEKGSLNLAACEMTDDDDGDDNEEGTSEHIGIVLSSLHHPLQHLCTPPPPPPPPHTTHPNTVLKFLLLFLMPSRCQCSEHGHENQGPSVYTSEQPPASCTCNPS